MKALKYIGILLLTLLSVFLILGLVAPKKTHLERSISISAPPTSVQAVVAKFSEYNKWSPWAEYDTNMVVKLEGQDGNVGSKYSWIGNKQVGKGNQTITKIEPGLVETNLVLEEPMSSQAKVGMKLVEENDGTKATWSFDSETPFPWNAMSFFFNMEKLVGPDYEKGLAKLKKYVESTAAKKYRGYDIREMDSPGNSFLGIRKIVAFQDIPTFFDQSMGTINAALKKANLEMTGPPTGLFYVYDEKTGTTDMVAAAPVKDKSTAPGLTPVTIPAGKELCVEYYGALEKTGEAHYALDDYIKEKGLKSGTPVIEQYMTDPMAEKDTAKWLTKIIYPIIK